MGKFLVFIDEDNGHNVADKIKELYPKKNYKIRDDLWFVNSQELSMDLSEQLGFGR